MSVDTITIESQEGQKFVLPDTTQNYKDIVLFGKNYLNWVESVNQTHVILMDAIDAIRDNGLSEIQFDLETYTEQEKVKRTEEFNIWKREYKQILEQLISDSNNSMDTVIEEIKNSINTNMENVDQKLLEFSQASSSRLDEIQNAFTEEIDTKIQENVAGLAESIALSTEKLNTAIENVNAAKNTLETASDEIKNVIQSFKNEFNNTFETFKMETTETLSRYKENIIAYIDEKFGGASSRIDSESARIDRMEIIIESITPDILKSFINNGISSTATSIMENYMGDLKASVDNFKNFIDDQPNKTSTAIKDYVDPKLEAINETLSSNSETLGSMNNTLNQNSVAAGKVGEWVTLFEEKELSIFGANEYQFMDEIFNELLSLEYINSRNFLKTNTENMTIEKIKEKIGLQNLENNKNLLNYIDTKFNLLLELLSKGENDELYLASNLVQTQRNSIITNTNTNIKDIKLVKALPEIKILDFNIRNTTAPDSTTILNHMYLVFSLPVGLSPTSLFVTNTRTGTRSEVTTYIDTETNPMGLQDSPAGETYYFINDCVSSNDLLGIADIGLVKTDTIRLEITTHQTGNDTIPGTTYTRNLVISEYLDGAITLNKIKDLRDYNFVNDTAAMNAINNPSIPNLGITNTTSGILIPKKEIIEYDGNYYLHLKVKLQESYILKTLELTYNGNVISYTFDNIDTPTTRAALDALRGAWQFNYFKDLDSTGLLIIPLTGTIKTTKAGATTTIPAGEVQAISAKIIYNNGSDVTKNLTIKALSGSSTKFVTATIAQNAFHEIDTLSLFGTAQGKNTLVDVKIKDSVVGSETLGMYLNADTITTVVIKDERYIRIYNEFPTSSEFYIAITPR